MSTDSKDGDSGRDAAGAAGVAKPNDTPAADSAEPKAAAAAGTTKPNDAPAAKAATQKSSTPKTASRAPAGRGPGTLIAVLALLVALAALGASWQAWQQSAGTRAALDEIPPALGRVEARIDALDSDVDAIAPRLETGLRREIEAFDERLAALHDLLRKTATPAHEPADIEHLLLIANDSLILQHDVTTALAALRSADERLRALADPAFADTRRRLASEIAALQSLPRPDITGAAFAISGLQQQIDALTLESLRAPGGAREAPGLADDNGEPGDLSGWRAVMEDLWARLSSLFVIRRGDEADGPLIAPDQRVFLNQNLRLQLESARLALLSRDAEGLRHHLGIARDWLARHYDADDARVAALLGGIDELARLDIAPDMPDISASLKALREALERRRGPILDDAGAAASGQGS